MIAQDDHEFVAGEEASDELAQDRELVNNGCAIGLGELGWVGPGARERQRRQRVEKGAVADSLPLLDVRSMHVEGGVAADQDEFDQQRVGGVLNLLPVDVAEDVLVGHGGPGEVRPPVGKIRGGVRPLESEKFTGRRWPEGPGHGANGAVAGPVEILGQRCQARSEQQVVPDLAVQAHSARQGAVREPGGAAEGRGGQVGRAHPESGGPQGGFGGLHGGCHPRGVIRVGEHGLAIGFDHEEEHRGAVQGVQVRGDAPGPFDGRFDGGLVPPADAFEIQDRPYLLDQPGQGGRPNQCRSVIKAEARPGPGGDHPCCQARQQGLSAGCG